MARPSFRGVLLCEDIEHERFFRRLLNRWFGRRKLRVNRIPNREGAGDAYVIANYAREVQLARRWRFENYALVVAIDGDRKKLHGRMQQLDQELEDAGLPKRGNDEMIVVCVPTWSIETWELWLCGERDVEEETDCKRRFQDAERRGDASPRKAVESWFRDLSEGELRLEEETLPSVAAGRQEVQRLDR
jgi:hypothetical protein